MAAPLLIQPLISVARRRMIFLWLVHASEYDRGGLGLDEYGALLRERFPGYRHSRERPQPPEIWERFDATNTLALVIAEGMSWSREQAVADAMEASRAAAPDLLPARVEFRYGGKVPSASWVNDVAKARQTLRNLDRLDAMAAECDESGSSAPRYVYCRVGEYYTDGYDYPAAFHRHRIQRETKAYVFVEEASDWRNWGETYEDSGHFRSPRRDTCRLKRAWIDGTEEVPYSVRRRFHYSSFDGFAWREEGLRPLESPLQARAGHLPPSLLQALGLNSLPGTDAELRRAYRAAVRRAHPDTGGSAEEFQTVQRAYETLSQRFQ